ncbi:MAG: hypothetical protein LC437_05520 [Thiohalomonas sp.]|nr:hypothetical protein [Thiohalomonas sp.]
MDITKKSYLWSGQQTCHDGTGQEINCISSGQDAEFRNGCSWPLIR